MKDQVDQLNKAGLGTFSIGIGEEEKERELRRGGLVINRLCSATFEQHFNVLSNFL